MYKCIVFSLVLFNASNHLNYITSMGYYKCLKLQLIRANLFKVQNPSEGFGDQVSVRVILYNFILPCFFSGKIVFAEIKEDV